MVDADSLLAETSPDISILRSFKGSAYKKKLQQHHESERLIAVLEEQSPDLQKPFIENAGKILRGQKLKADDKKALGAFLKTVAADADLLPADKKAIDQFFKRGLSTGAKIGIGVGSAAAMTALIAMAVVAAKSGISRGMSAALKAVGDAGARAGSGSVVTGHAPVPAPTHTPVGAILVPYAAGSSYYPLDAEGSRLWYLAHNGGAASADGARVSGSGQTPVAGAGAGAGSSSHARSGDSRVMKVAEFYFGADTPSLEVIGTSVLAVPQGLVRVGHLKNIKGRADQDACLVDVLPDGALRICLCDGTGESPLDHVFATEYLAAPLAEDHQQEEVILSEKKADPAAYVKIGGAGAATFIVNQVRKLSITPSCDKFNEIARLMHQQTDPIKRALDSSLAGDVSAKREVFAARKNPLLGGSSAISSVVLSSDGRMVEWSNLGDSGAFFLTTDGKMMHGPSLHPNLEGFHYKNGTTRMGYDDLDRQCEDVESFTSIVPENARYLVVACDGLMDCMKGPRRRITAEDHDAYEQGLRTRKRSSINTDKLYSEEEINAMWEYACGDPLDTGSPEWLKKEYGDCKEGLPPITVRMLISCLEQAKRSGHNPGQALADLARSKGSKDDITVVVIDLSSLREGLVAGSGATAGEAVRAEVASGDSRIGEAPAGADASVATRAGVGDGSGAGEGVGSENNETIQSLGLPVTKTEFDAWLEQYTEWTPTGISQGITHPDFGRFLYRQNGQLFIITKSVERNENFDWIALARGDQILWHSNAVTKLLARREELQKKGANATEGASTGDETGSPPASVGAGAESGYGSGDFRCSEDSNIRALLEELAVQIVLPENETDLLKWMQDYDAEQGIPGEKFFCYSVEIGDFALRHKIFLWQPEDTCPMVTLVPDIHREQWLWSLSGLRKLKNHVAKVFSASSVSTEASGAESGEVVSVGGGSEAGVGGLPLAGAGAGAAQGKRI